MIKSCGPGNIDVSNGTSEKMVYKMGDLLQTNLALSKMNFV